MKKAQRYIFNPHNGGYLFVTDNGSIYLTSIYHRKDLFNANEFLSNSGYIYELSVEKLAHGEDSRKDDSVSTTILHILSTNIMSKGDSSVFYYVCDTLDRKGHCRATLFKKWFPYLQQEIPTLQHHSFVILGAGGESDYYVSLLIHQDHLRYDDYVKTFGDSLDADFAKRT